MDSAIEYDSSGRRAELGHLLAPLTAVANSRRLTWLGLWGVGTTLTLAAVAFGTAHRGPYPPLVLVLAVTATAPLLFVGRWPAVALPVVVASNATFVIWGRLPWPPTAVVAWLLALAVCPLVLQRQYSLVILMATEVAVLTGAFMPSSVNPRPWDAPVTEALAVALVWGGAGTLRARQLAARERVEIGTQMRVLERRAEMAASRAEIARELHDVVAHHVSLIAVRAATAPYQLGTLPVATATAFSEIADEARVALEELRAVLGVLRSSSDGAPQTPQPGLDDLPELVKRMRSNGMSLTVNERGSRTATNTAVDLCCYRVVQEALTNAARHAPGTPVEIDLVYDSDEITLQITNQGGPHVASDPRGDNHGFGLIGMRERVAGLGGHVAVTRLITGFQIQARIPLEPPTAVQ